jgi:hypothetical protein
MVELIHKKIQQRALPLHNIFFYAALAVLALVIAAFALLVHFEGRSSTLLQDLENQILQIGTKEEKQTEKEIFATKKKIDSFSKLIDIHKKPSLVFPLLEETVHPQIWLTGFDFNIESNILEISGEADNFRILAEQVNILKEKSEILGISLSDIAISDTGNASFSLFLTLDPKIFK